MNAKGPTALDPRPAEIPLSFAQRRFWFLNRLEGPSPNYNELMALRFVGDFDRTAVVAAVHDIVARHEVLRTVFPERDGVARQDVQTFAGVKPSVPVVRLSTGALQRYARAAAAQRFDLRTQLPFRTEILEFGPADHLLLMVFHHVAIDAWSNHQLVIPELLKAYHARARGAEPEFPPLPFQYADFTVWQHAALGRDRPGSRWAEQMAFWTDALHALPPILRLPTERPRPTAPSYAGGNVPIAIDAALHTRLVALARDRRASLFMLLQAALAVLLTRLGAGDDIPVGVPVSGRMPALKGIVGCFANTMVARTDTGGNPTFLELLEQVRRTALAACVHTDVPFDQVVEAVAPRRSLSHNPLFQVLLGMMPITPVTIQRPTNAKVYRMPLRFGEHARFDLMIDLFEGRGPGGMTHGITGIAQYATDLFDRRSIEELIARYGQLLASVAERPDQRIGAIDIRLDGERAAVAVAPVAPANRASWPDVFARQVRRTPDAVAVVCDGAAWTYAGIDSRASRLARHLAALHVGVEDVVGIALPRSSDLIVALLAALKQHACWLPLDPEEPFAELTRRVGHARPRVVITSAAIAGVLGGEWPLVIVDSAGTAAQAPIAGQPVVDAPDDRALCIAYTSTKGTARGAVMSHANGQHLLAALDEVLPLGVRDRVLAAAPVSSDVALLELIRPLLRGAAVVLAPHPDPFYPSLLALLCHESQVSLVHATPRMARAIAAARPAALAGVRVVTIGDALTRGTVERLRASNARVSVLLSTAETGAALAADVHSADVAEALGGHVLQGATAQPLDCYGRVLPSGVAGVLHVGGPGVARGYAGDPAATALHFVPSSTGAPGARVFRASTAARIRRDGTLELCRLDDADGTLDAADVCRVEDALRRLSGVEDACVVREPREDDDQRLIAYLAPVAGARLDVDAIGHRLSRMVPGHLMPDTLVTVPGIPLSADGRIDGPRLPPPIEVAPAVRAPASELEAAFCRVFSETLGVTPVHPDDNFFDLGGHSLLAVCLAERARSAVGAPMDVRAVFEDPTPARLAASLAASPVQEATT